MEWSLVAEVIGLIIVVILMLFFYEKKSRLSYQDRIYQTGLWLSIFTIALDIICVFTITETGVFPIWFNIALNSLYFFMLILLSTVLAVYLFVLLLEHVYDKRCLRRAFACVGILFIVYTIIVLYNLKSGVLFYFKTNGTYVRGEFNFLGYLVVAIELLMLIVCYLKNRVSVNKSTRTVIYTMPTIALMIIAFQQLYPDLLLNGILIAIVQMILFINFQGLMVEFDGLTRIRNRKSLFSELSLRTAGKQPLYIILFGLRQFSLVNQKFGHRKGDSFLYEIAQYLDSLSPEAQAFRFGNVEFAVILPYTNEEDANQVLAQVYKRLNRPWELGDIHYKFSSYFTDFTYTGKGENSPIRIIGFLEYCLNLAKSQGKEIVHCDNITAKMLQRQETVVEILKQSIEEKRFQVWYQPIYCCKDGQFCFAEALLRLWDLNGEPISPSEFIPLAEANGMINSLSRIVLEDVCKFLGSGRCVNLKSVSINLSMLQFLNDDLFGWIEDTMNKYGVRPDMLKLEITERTLLKDLEYMKQTITSMKAKGIHFYLDDFGTGYSNFSSIINLPFECIKLDRSMIVEYPCNEKASMAVSSLTNLFHNMGYKVIVEGIETEEQSVWLQSCGVDLLQGFYYAKPMSEESTTQFMVESSVS